MKLVKQIFIPVVATLPLIAASCNNDGVILPDEPSEPEVPGGDDDNSMHPAGPESSMFSTRVFEWTPAPGQFINDPSDGSEWNADTTPEEAAAFAEGRLSKGLYVSLGGFGGYIVVGFDHSIVNCGQPEIAILGNAFLSPAGSSCEPGIVYVMQDENGNGMPDDTWYELIGSDTFAPTTSRDYSITYYRPEKDGEPVLWADSHGNEGKVPYLGMFHSQPTYYPVWIKTPSYTLTGTCLAARTERNPDTGNWANLPFEWGYADNVGSDWNELTGLNGCNLFSISNAIDADGNSVELKYIDFVKVQTGVNSSAGVLGEVSTEVLGFVDMNLYTP